MQCRESNQLSLLFTLHCNLDMIIAYIYNYVFNFVMACVGVGSDEKGFRWGHMHQS